MTVLARAALAQPAALDLLRNALTAHSGDLAVPAMSVAVETNPVVAEPLCEALTARPASAPVLERIADAAPYPSFALAPVAAIVLAQLVGQVTDAGPRASRLLDLSNRLGELGRGEEALAAIDEAVTIRRDLARAWPDAFLPDLAASLNNQSIQLGELGRGEEALAAIDEAVTVYRDLAGARPDAFLPDLARSLNRQSNCLGGLGRGEEALAVIDQAVTVHRDLARARPDAFLPGLAVSLNNQSVHLGGVGRREEALAAIGEAITVRRALARARPHAFLPDLARSLKPAIRPSR
jgi:tetratricopeptide (TPR) repeat protein